MSVTLTTEEYEELLALLLAVERHLNTTRELNLDVRMQRLRLERKEEAQSRR
jgi:hypothetical protein